MNNPRSLMQVPLSVSSRKQFNHEKEWVRSVNDHQFWSYQYAEHAEMIHLILNSFKASEPNKTIYEKYSAQALEYQQFWADVYNQLIQNNEARISNEALEKFRQFKLSLLKDLSEKPDWKGWAPLSIYDHMAREVEYLQEPKDAIKVLSFWLTDMHGHASLDAAWTDPEEESLVKKAKELADAYGDLKKHIGEGTARGHFSLINRTQPQLQLQFPKGTVPLQFVSGDLRELLNRLIILQNGLTVYQTEYKYLANSGKISTTMTPEFIDHTLRESLRANYELEMLAQGKIVV
jgi:hypothetical protein